jgi:type II secretory pathway component PulF
MFTSNSASSADPQTQLDALKLRIASKVAPRAWSSALESLAQGLQAGKTWHEATNASAWRADANLRALVGAALRSGRPADVTLELLQRRAHTMSSWRDLISTLAYPVTLLAFALLVASLTGVLMMSVIDQHLVWN